MHPRLQRQDARVMSRRGSFARPSVGRPKLLEYSVEVLAPAFVTRADRLALEPVGHCVCSRTDQLGAAFRQDGPGLTRREPGRVARSPREIIMHISDEAGCSVLDRGIFAVVFGDAEEERLLEFCSEIGTYASAHANEN